MKWSAIQYDLAERLIKLEFALRPYISDSLYKGSYDHRNTFLNQNHTEQINTKGKKTLLGHRIPSQADDLDNILIDAKSPLSVHEIAAELNLNLYRVKNHLNHLQKVHKCRFEITDGKYRLILE